MKSTQVKGQDVSGQQDAAQCGFMNADSKKVYRSTKVTTYSENLIFSQNVGVPYMSSTWLQLKDTVSEEEVMRGNLERCSRARLCIKILKSRVEDVMAVANSGGINA